MRRRSRRLAVVTTGADSFSLEHDHQTPQPAPAHETVRKRAHSPSAIPVSAAPVTPTVSSRVTQPSTASARGNLARRSRPGASPCVPSAPTPTTPSTRTSGRLTNPPAASVAPVSSSLAQTVSSSDKPQVRSSRRSPPTHRAAALVPERKRRSSVAASDDDGDSESESGSSASSRGSGDRRSASPLRVLPAARRSTHRISPEKETAERSEAHAGNYSETDFSIWDEDIKDPR